MNIQNNFVLLKTALTNAVTAESEAVSSDWIKTAQGASIFLTNTEIERAKREVREEVV